MPDEDDKFGPHFPRSRLALDIGNVPRLGYRNGMPFTAFGLTYPDSPSLTACHHPIPSRQSV
jgi:hypothetical protein